MVGVRPDPGSEYFRTGGLQGGRGGNIWPGTTCVVSK